MIVNFKPQYIRFKVTKIAIFQDAESIGWLKFVDNIKLSTFVLIGAGIILLDTLVIVLGWRS